MTSLSFKEQILDYCVICDRLVLLMYFLIKLRLFLFIRPKTFEPMCSTFSSLEPTFFKKIDPEPRYLTAARESC